MTDRTHPPRRSLLLALLAAALLVGCTVTDGQDRGANPEGGSPTGTADDSAQGGTVGASFGSIPDIIADVQPSIVSLNVTVERAGRTGMGTGSGVIWSEDGVIVTNNHVVAPAEDIEVVLANGERFPAEIVATDPRTDLAVLRIDASGLPAADFADRLPELGELAVALGNPLGFRNSASAGIVSGLDRSLPAGEAALVGLIQTDAPISSGNSGGALVDHERLVIGISVAAIGGSAGGAEGQVTAENVGFAIPATTVITVVEQLLENGEVSHPFLGVRGATLTPQIAERFGIERDAGVVVAEVVADSPAAEAGIEPGHVIVGLAGEEVRRFGDLASALRQHEVGDTIDVTVARDGQEETIEVELAELPDGEPAP